MTPTRLRACLEALRWSQRGLAEAVGRSEGAVRQMARGARPIPVELASWLETLAAVHEANPPPVLVDGRSSMTEVLRTIAGADRPLPAPSEDMQIIAGTKRWRG